MAAVHPYAQQLASSARARTSQRLSLKARTLLQGFGYQARSDQIVAEIQGHLAAAGLAADLSLQHPPNLDERITVTAVGGAELFAQAATRPASSWPAGDNLPAIAARAVPATVQVLTETGAGSGFIVHPDGLVVTARHVVDDGGLSLRKVDVRVGAGQDHARLVEGIVVRSHRQLDFALLWLLADGPFPTMPLGNPASLQFAQTVLAVGFPAGLINTVSAGIVANPCQLYRGVECIQTNADIDHGNSGGPLISGEGVVGITVWGLGNMSHAKFAVPIDYFMKDIAAAVAHGKEACLPAAYCRACGHVEYGPGTWYCRNCGRQPMSEEQ